jgi:hypothetical protein
MGLFKKEVNIDLWMIGTGDLLIWWDPIRDEHLFKSIGIAITINGLC